MLANALTSNRSRTVEDAPLGDLFIGLADLLADGDEPIAAVGASALRRHAGEVTPAEYCEIEVIDEIERLAGSAPYPAEMLNGSIRRLDWHHSGSRGGHIREDISKHMLTVELVGANGMAFDEACRVGLFAQSPNLDYPERSHAAEELFVMLAGSGWWRQSGRNERLCHPHDRIHHASHHLHASRTGSAGLIALWVWAGDVRFETYRLNG